MKITLDIVGALLVLAGGVWFLQGINVLPGSVMSGQTQWVIYGGVVAVIGIGLQCSPTEAELLGLENR